MSSVFHEIEQDLARFGEQLTSMPAQSTAIIPSFSTLQQLSVHLGRLTELALPSLPNTTSGVVELTSSPRAKPGETSRPLHRRKAYPPSFTSANMAHAVAYMAMRKRS